MDQDLSNNPTPDGDWNWTAFFDTIANDAQGAASKSCISTGEQFACPDLFQLSPSQVKLFFQRQVYSYNF